MSDILKIFVPTHNVPIIDDDTFMPIQVGAALHPDLNLCTLKDNDGDDNISDRNGYYCELTAHYWVWKNAKRLYPNLKYVGFCHYRRWFNFGSDAEMILKHPDQWFGNKRKMACFNKEGFGKQSIRMCYYLDHQFQDWDMDEQIMRERYPEWAKQFYSVTNEPNIFMYGKNSFVMRWEDFDKYCTEMFDILFEHDKRFGITPDNFMKHGELYKTSPYRWNNDFARQSRFNGYTAERIGSSWYQFNMDEIKSFPYVWFNKYNMKQTPTNELTGKIGGNAAQNANQKSTGDKKVVRVIRRQPVHSPSVNTKSKISDIKFNIQSRLQRNK